MVRLTSPAVVVVITSLLLNPGIPAARAQLKIYWANAGTQKIQRANLDGSNIEDLVTTGLTTPSGITLDALAGKMYWTDGGSGTIQRADLDGSNVQDLVTGLTEPFGIALDLTLDKMYWTDSGTAKIQRANLDGSLIEDLITTGLVTPRGIALDTASYTMYWADSDAHKIQRAYMSGTFAEDLVVGGGFFEPQRIALDLTARKVYWTAFVFEEGIIERADLDGTNLEPLVSTGTGVGGPATHGIGLDASRGHMYWTEWLTDGSVWRANLDGSSREKLISGLGAPFGLALELRRDIPTVSVWGVIALTLLLLAGGSIVIARKRTGTGTAAMNSGDR